MLTQGPHEFTHKVEALVPPGFSAYYLPDFQEFRLHCDFVINGMTIHDVWGRIPRDDVERAADNGFLASVLQNIIHIMANRAFASYVQKVEEEAIRLEAAMNGTPSLV